MAERIRPWLSALVVTTLVVASEGIMLSLHWCCGTVESVTFYTTDDNCCCQSEEASGCSITEGEDCCHTTAAYFLLPVGGNRTDEGIPFPPIALRSVHRLPLQSLQQISPFLRTIPTEVPLDCSLYRLRRLRL